jgi:uncharacterized membrane-anchored protein
LRIRGPVKLDKRTKNLVKRLKPGDIAVIDHEDIDSTAALMLVDAGVRAVINAAKSSTGRYPNLGPSVLIDAGIPIVDNIGGDLFKGLREGETIEVADGALCRNGDAILHGEVLTKKRVAELLEESKANLGTELEKFAENTLTYVTCEKSILLDPSNLPEIRTVIAGRHALVVVRGEGYHEDLATIRTYIRDVKPVLIGVDGGADALVELGLKPDIIVGDMDSVSDAALKSGAELVVHAYADGRAPGLGRVEELGLATSVCSVPGTSEDLALLLAYEKGAELIVAVGTHSHLVDFLDKGRRGMSSTFLVRLKVGHRLVDAKGVSKLYLAHPKARVIGVLILAAMILLFTVIALSPDVQDRIRTAMNELWWKAYMKLRVWEWRR